MKEPVEVTDSYRNHVYGCTDEYEHPGGCRLDDGQPRGSKKAADMAAQLPVVADDDADDEMISLADIAVTGIEHHEWLHFWTKDYTPDADGVKVPWATIWPLKDSGKDEPVALNETTMRKAVELYLDNRLKAGMRFADAAMMVDGVYTDAVVADSILQFALYGEEVYG